MIGIIVQLAISWVLLRFLEKKNLGALGVQPTGQNLIALGLGTLVASVCYLLYIHVFALLAKFSWESNPAFGLSSFLEGSWWTLKSVLFEELIFRGALLYILIRRVGHPIAITTSAVAFGVYHWFSYGALGDPITMAFVFVWTGSWGLMFAYAFTKTGSLYLPVGLHVGWNLCNIFVFSQGPLGEQWYVPSGDGQPIAGWLSLIPTFLQLTLLPLLTIGWLRKYSWKIQPNKP